eukprot:TRINITY_DN74369_c0_g1_i1.p1 TRINITY_DN74369_c0_g1~~TRINITY_DN74369_c0_g1_i1.p1  ORF type:complete len:368 (+),score=66.03 TRINITY_DN74369_c0_g1_i1:26-1105(+)
MAKGTSRQHGCQLAFALGFAASLAWLATPKAWNSMSLRASAPVRRRSRSLALQAVPIGRVGCGPQLLEKLSEEDLGPLGRDGELELGMPGQDDVQGLTLLMHQCFDRIFLPKRLPEGVVLDVLGIAEAANRYQEVWELEDIEKGLKVRLDLSLQFPTLRKPTKQEQTVPLIARARGPRGFSDGPVVAYVELCVLAADGRRPEDEIDAPSGAAVEPYLSNLCVLPGYRRQGIGSAMLKVAEEVVSKIWKGRRVYLHIDKYEPAKSLYEGSGYIPVKPTGSDGVTHMVKELAEPEEEEDEDESGMTPEEAGRLLEGGRSQKALGPGTSDETGASDDLDASEESGASEVFDPLADIQKEAKK